MINQQFNVSAVTVTMDTVRLTNHNDILLVLFIVLTYTYAPVLIYLLYLSCTLPWLQVGVMCSTPG